MAQSRPGTRKPVPNKRRQARSPECPARVRQAAARVRAHRHAAGRRTEEAPPPMVVSKLKLKKPVLVYYEEPAPGKAVQQLIMAEENLGLLKTLDLEHLMAAPRSICGWPGQPGPAGQRRSQVPPAGHQPVAEDDPPPRRRRPQLLLPPESALVGRALRGARVGRRVPPLRERPAEKGLPCSTSRPTACRASIRCGPCTRCAKWTRRSAAPAAAKPSDEMSQRCC